LKLLSYNVNGIRAALKKGFASWLKATQADVICIQETKAQESQVDTAVLEAFRLSQLLVFSTKKRLQWSCNFLKAKAKEY
jgi:exodeoxyribonuclease-3